MFTLALTITLILSSNKHGRDFDFEGAYILFFCLDVLVITYTALIIVEYYQI